MKQQKYSGVAHFIIVTVILVIGLVGSLGYIVWDKVIDKEQDVSNVQEEDSSSADDSEKVSVEDETVEIADLFTEDLNKFTNKTLIGTNDNYDVYVLDNTAQDMMLEGEILVYSKPTERALKINKILSVWEVGISEESMKQYSDNYLLVDSGTSPYRAKQLIMLSEKDVIAFNSAVPASVGGENVQYWNNYFIYSGADSEYDGTSYKTSIFSLNLSTKEVKKIIAWSGDKSYFINSVSGDTLNYIEFNGITPESSSVTNQLTFDLNAIK